MASLNKLVKRRIEKTPGFKKHNSDIECRTTEKSNFKTKNNHFEKPHDAANSKKNTFGLFENPICCKLEKIQGEFLETLKNFR